MTGRTLRVAVAEKRTTGALEHQLHGHRLRIYRVHCDVPAI